jgi:NRPS condensation-like uncharacterized protein
MKSNNNTRYKAEVFDIMQFIFSSFNDHQLHCVINFNKHIDDICLKRAVDMSSRVFALIKCRFVQKWRVAYWEECDFTSEDIVKIFETENSETQIEKLVVFKTDETIGPQIRINIARSQACDSICIIINHMLCDANGFKEYLYMLSSIYSHLMKDVNYKPDFIMGSRSAQQIFKQFSIFEKVKILFSSAKLSKYDSGVEFKFEGDTKNPFIGKHNISSDRFLSIKSYAKKNNATINDVILTAYIRVLHKFLDCGGIPIPCAVDLRKYLPEKKGEIICNLVSNMICDIGTDLGDTFNETLSKVKLSMDAEKRSLSCLKGPLLLEIIFKLLPYKIAKKIVAEKFKNPPIHITNIGLIDKSKLVFDNLEIKNSYINGSIKYKPYFQVAVTTFDNEVTFSINFSGTENDKGKIDDFLLALDEELSQVQAG